MSFKKYKIWGLLGVTLLLAYFAPPKDVGSSHAKSDEISSSIRAALSNMNKNEKPTNQMEVLDLVARVDEQDSESILPVFSKAFQPPVTADVSPKDKSKNEEPAFDNTPVEKTRVEAPPLPFKMLGKYFDSGDQVVFVKHKNENLVLHAGDVFLEKYKLEEIGAKSLTFIYLPMDIKQTLNLAH